jgi:hypothetical protein
LSSMPDDVPRFEWRVAVPFAGERTEVGDLLNLDSTS